MNFFEPRLTPTQVHRIAGTIHKDPALAHAFAHEVIDRLVKLIPDDGLVPAERLEEAFVMAVEVRRIFELSELNIWDFFQRPQARSLLGHVFISAVDGRSLSDIIREAQARGDTKQGDGRYLFDATAFKRRHLPLMILA
jgi:hypothetical protein